MKKTTLLNSEISAVVAKMGHTDMLVIADCGLPVPEEVKRIDLALVKGVPGFIETLKAVLSELQVEEVVIAREMTEKSPQVYQQIREIFKDTKIETVSHQDFKNTVAKARACVRTGECTPYANIILKSGVIF
ncbi:MAG: D-ribose pyranase [Bacillota bacterium]